ncbi:MAG: 50S ribosomal protein L24 [Proteobacteria bacterium]|nr:50S ribosomal protein L24 [Pseudomonadota bacterium]MDA0953484.1 50S ribosomal protein L24 [Pseudomonadota bacterium]HBZ49596.1 50S ribosomal protein L24 [Halieaceae bacterium]
MMKIKRDDEVIVLAGKDKGKRGKVRKVIGTERLIVTGVNRVKKHTKANPQAGIAGGIIEQEASIHVSNVAIYNAKTNEADRVGYKIEDGKKTRVFKSTGESIDA